MSEEKNIESEIIEGELFRDCRLLQLFLWCVLRAKKEGGEIEKAGDYTVNTGEVITGRYVTSKELGITSSMFVRKLNRLKELGYVNTKSVPHATCVTVNNYSTYVKGVQAEITTCEHTYVFKHLTCNMELLTNVSNCAEHYARSTRKVAHKDCGSKELRPLLDYFATNYQAAFGKPYIISWGRDSKCFKMLLDNGLTFVTLTTAIQNYFKDNDKFVTNRGHSITLFQ